MKVMVTGNLGYIGTVLTAILRQKGYKIIGVDNDLYEQCNLGNQDPENVLTLHKDIRELENSDFNGVEAVCHLAGLPNGKQKLLPPSFLEEINHQATIKLAQMAQNNGVSKFIFASSTSCYGQGYKGLLNENAFCDPSNAYAISKLKAEYDLQAMADSSFSPIILRIGQVYGFSPRMRFDLLINRMVAMAFTQNRIEIKKNDQSWRPIIHLIDVALGFALALQASRELVHNRIFNLGRTEDNYQLSDIIKIISGFAEDYILDYNDKAFSDNEDIRIDCDFIKEQLQFKGQWHLVSGIRQLFNAYKYYNITAETLDNPMYNRSEYLDYLLADNIINSQLMRIPEQEEILCQ